MSDIVVGLGPDLAETPPRTCSRAVAQNDQSPPGEQKAIPTGEGNRLRNPFHTQPAVAARKHDEVRQICGWHLFVGRRDFVFGLLFLLYAPRGCGFEPVQTESGYVHRSEDVCYRVQLSLHLLSKAIVFREPLRNCAASLVGQVQHQVEEASTMTDILLPSSITTPTLLFSARPSSINNEQNSSV